MDHMTPAQAEAHKNGIAAARDAFLASGKSLTIHSRDGSQKGKISGDLDARLEAAIDAYCLRQA